MTSKLSFAFGADAAAKTPEELTRQRALVEALMKPSATPKKSRRGSFVSR